MDGVKNMNKYDNMIEWNRKASEEKISKAKSAIREMIEDEEKVTIPKLMKKTGLSRGFFYKNPTVRKEMDRALDLQAGMVDSKRKVLDLAMENRIELLEKTIRELKKENKELKQKNEKQQKLLNKKNLSILKS
jgi:DNA-binding protein H-NS